MPPRLMHASHAGTCGLLSVPRKQQQCRTYGEVLPARATVFAVDFDPAIPGHRLPASRIPGQRFRVFVVGDVEPDRLALALALIVVRLSGEINAWR